MVSFHDPINQETMAPLEALAAVKAIEYYSDARKLQKIQLQALQTPTLPPAPVRIHGPYLQGTDKVMTIYRAIIGLGVLVFIALMIWNFFVG